MKNILFLLFAFMMLLISCNQQTQTSDPPATQVELIQTVDQVIPATTIDVPVMFVQDTGDVEESSADEEESDSNFFLSYWLELLVGLMAFIKIIVNLTPTEKDNRVFAWIDSIFNAIIPNYKKGGGTFSSES